jgi:hypothetical protein
MRELLAPDLIAWVTNADGEADRVTGGREEYLARIAAMDLPAAQYRVTLTQWRMADAKPAEVIGSGLDESDLAA